MKKYKFDYTTAAGRVDGGLMSASSEAEVRTHLETTYPGCTIHYIHATI